MHSIFKHFEWSVNRKGTKIDLQRKPKAKIRLRAIQLIIFPRGPLETSTLHDQSLLVSPKGRFGNAEIFERVVSYDKG